MFEPKVIMIINETFILYNVCFKKSRKGEIFMTIGERVKAVRKNKALTQTELGNLIMTSHSYISRVENGFELPTARWIKLVSLALNVNFNWLMYGNTEGNKNVDNSKASSGTA